MAKRQINNITIMAEVGELVTLPSQVIAIDDNETFQYVDVTWTPSRANTSQEGDFIFEGKVKGYVHKVLLSLVVGKQEENPISVFPGGIDAFGIEKKDLHSADIPDIDDFQYLKAKTPRTNLEQEQLKALTELLADKIILARDINHQRNAIVKIEEHALSIQTRVEKLEVELDKLTKRVTVIEKDMVVDGENVGTGSKVFKEKKDKKLQLRTLKGTGGVDVYEVNNEIVIDGTDLQSGCGKEIEASKFQTCPKEGGLPVEIFDSAIRFGSPYFGMNMVEAKGKDGGKVNTLLWMFGVGDDEASQVNAGRMLKGKDAFVIEMKIGKNSYTGLLIDKNGARTYTSAESEITALLTFDAYSSQARINYSKQK